MPSQFESVKAPVDTRIVCDDRDSNPPQRTVHEMRHRDVFVAHSQPTR